MRRRLQPVGFWAHDDEPSEFVDPSWDPAQRAQVVAYLKSGQVAESWMGSAYCRLGCFNRQMASVMGSRDFTDGVWLWPEGYAHYLEVHQVKPPREFIERVLRTLSA